jgi:serine/threonine protein kinase
MSGVSSRQIDKALFEAAAEIHEQATRHAFLTQACGGDATQQTRVEGWLDARAAAEEFFQTAVQARVEAGADVGEVLAADGANGDDSGAAGAAAAEDGPGSLIGRYRLLERIGEGGCGVVFLAEQREPVRRRVALKVIRLGLDTETVIARFEMERQALALMDHPNIAHVLDAGTTASGRPYFVMELIHGMKITEHCDANRLDLPQRLELFIQVCHAIQHAHQKGVIHRDIKPSNILVSSQDGLAVPKVIDFGIARAIEGRLTDNTLFTLCNQFIGTPAYMSPEQAEGGQDMDTRSDVYSLGVLLSEILTGRTPFDATRLAQAGMFEMLRILREEDAPTPSAVLAKLDAAELAGVAARHAAVPGQLVAAVRGDLDWIVLKALAKDRQNRYDTVNALALDLRRFLEDEPVLARPPARFYLFGKLVRRNKAVFASAAVAALTLVAGLGVSSWFYLREREARQAQVKLRQAAEAARANEARLLRQSTARESISMAAFLLAEGKIEEADALLVKTPLASIDPSLEATNVLRSLGDWNAIRQRWRQAADCYTLFLQANRLERTPAPARGLMDLIAVGPTLVKAGDLASYRRFREDAASLHGLIADRDNTAILVKACLLLPADEALLERLRPAAAMLVGFLSKDSEPRAGDDGSQSAFIAMSLGLSDYRRGDFAQAMAWNRKCLAFPDSNQARSATAHVVSAMAAQRLGQPGLARAELALAREFFAGPFARDVYYPRGEGQGHWQDWAIARVLEREAAALIGETGPLPH